MRLLQVIGMSWSAPMHVLPMARALAAQGWEVDVACPGGPEVEGLGGAGVRHVPLPVSRSLATPAHLLTLWRLFRLLGGGRYRAVHVHGTIPGVLVRLAAWARGVPVVYHYRTSFFPEGEERGARRLLRSAYLGVERLLGRPTRRVFTLNEADARDFALRLGFPAERVSSLGVGGCGLDLARWSPARFGPAERARIRAELGIAPGRRVVGFVGRLVREKGVLELLEAFRLLLERGHDAHLLLVGGTLASERDRRTRPELERRIRDLGVGERVTSTGDVPDPERPMAVMDVMALPSYREGFGQVLVEAGAMGVPVVAAESRGTRHAVLDGETGLLVPPRDAAALAGALEALLADPARGARMGERAARRAREELGSARVAERVVEAYREILGAQAPGNGGRGRA